DCNYVTMAVFFWSYGEENVCLNTNGCTGPTRVFNQGTPWDGTTSANNINDQGRFVLSKVRLFRFTAQDINSSNMSGNYVGFYNPNGIPGNGPPNAVANTVKLVA